ncbi:tRNA glutamyl-Q(34) synthetase GluQRS [Methylobacterium durans]|uniref:tRNA glutamyl-Q(34) synthetase GluQRS n=1 Tax=Methylobacterium durans TaxID=2202825 RepID=UPI002AFF7F67|nr:tRNA glutamyl-Q(34) synthetase GluQRS [Methylobacterium durans]MEA1833955.1 tRNA glutamyl-Q(34) synthetase GluQRS [Methylobacterium durans]
MNAPVLRFAPSPNGRLHLGHAYSALLNARIAGILGGRLLLRIEDIDPVRSRPEFIAGIVEDLAWLGLHFPEPVRRQSEHIAEYRASLMNLGERGLVYPCFCSRGAVAARVAALAAEEIDRATDPDGTPHYPGTCRHLPAGEAAARRAAGEPHTWRLDMERARAEAPGLQTWTDFDPDGGERRVASDPTRWGDALVGRRDVPTSYHLSVVLDDAAQGITHVVRGQDLEAATDLHVLLQRLLGLPSPAYHHHALIVDEAGGKLAKSRGSASLADLRGRGDGPESVRAGLGFAPEA